MNVADFDCFGRPERPPRPSPPHRSQDGPASEYWRLPLIIAGLWIPLTLTPPQPKNFGEYLT